jgi:putative transposase
LVNSTPLPQSPGNGDLTVYVGEPECNGVIERVMRTLKEQCLYLDQFQTLAEAQRLIAEFITRYNAEWRIERLGHRTPAGARAAALAA